MNLITSLYMVAFPGASPGFGRGGPRIFFQIWKFGVRGHAPPRNFFKMVQFGAFWVYILITYCL